MEENERILASQDITDEMRIQFAVDEFYEFVKTYDGEPEKVTRMKLIRNNILNMMDTYLKKFKNNVIMNEFKGRLIKAKKEATKNGKIYLYTLFMNEIRVVQEFKGIKENIATKLAEQIFDNLLKEEMIKHVQTNDSR